jgi:transcriptional regulator with GAF, ATPase, and Fis domain
MGLKEKASKYKEATDYDKFKHLEERYGGKIMTKEDLIEFKNEIYLQIDNITSQLDRKLIDMQTLFEIGRELNSTLHVSDLLQIIIFTLMGQFQIGDVAIFSINESNADLIGNNGFVGIESFEISEQFAEFISSKDNAVDLSEMSGFDTECSYLKSFNAICLIPMKGKEDIAGFILIGNKMSGLEYNPEEKEFTYTMASLAGIALENAKLYDRLAQKYNELSTLYEVSKVINSSDDYNLVLSLILETVTTGFGVKTALLLSIKEDSCIIAESVGLDNAIKDENIELGETESSLMKANEVGIVEISQSIKEIAPNFDKALFVPLISVGTKVGALVIFDSEKYSIKTNNENLINLYSIIASQISPPIFMTKLIKQKQETIQDPFTPVLNLVESEILKANEFSLDVTFAMLKLKNFNKHLEFYGGNKTYKKFDILSSKIMKILPNTAETTRYSSNKILFILPGIAQTDFEDFKDAVLEVSTEVFKDSTEVDIGIDFLSIMYPDECQDKYSILSLIE